MFSSVLLFGVGLMLGRFWFGVVLLPLVYGIPRAVAWVWRGQLSPRAILIYVWPVVLWSLVSLALVVATTVFSPSLARFLATNLGFFLGQLVGVGFGVAQMLSKQGRRDLNSDFGEAVGRYEKGELPSPRNLEHTPTEVRWPIVIRDVVLWSILTLVGVGIVRVAGISSGMSLSASNSLFGCLGFAIAGCFTPVRRFRHLMFVTLGVWLTGIINVVMSGVSVTSWLLSLGFLLLTMVVGGALSFLFVPREAR
ncbi:MAG: hypothetical protein ABL971_09585 [Vicinamibacterales bacterium]